MMEEGAFVDNKAFCPLCKMEAGQGKTPPVGQISGKALTFLERRGIIDQQFQFRFMLQLHEIRRHYFDCPSITCDNRLMEVSERSEVAVLFVVV
jgi:hypothetical protein